MARSPVEHRPPRNTPFKRPDVAATRRVFRFQFIAETISELKKVTWPSRPEATRLTIMVILISIAIGFMLGIIDIGFSQLFNRFIFGGR